MSSTFELTRLASAAGVLTKRISLGEDGKLISDGSACVMGRGAAKRERVPSIQAFADLIGGLAHNEAIALGALRPDLPDLVQVVTAKKLAGLNGSALPDYIARTAGHIAYVAEQPAFALLDYDTKGMPEHVSRRVQELGGFWPAIVSVVPELEHCARVVRRSTSSGISRTDTGELIRGSDGQHVFVMVKDGSDVERFLRTLHDRCWLAGFGWVIVGVAGQILERSIVDRTVFSAERLVFEGAPILSAPLQQDPALRVPLVSEGDALDTVAACHSLTLVEKSKLTDLKQEEFERHLGPIGQAKRQFVTEQAARLVEKLSISAALATRIAERHRRGVLLPEVELVFDSEDLAGTMVGDVLDDPDRFVGATLADPLEGIAYGRCKAKVLRRGDGWPWIHSFAHGRTTYELRYDAPAIEKKLRAADAAGVVDLFIKLLVRADLEADQEQELRELVMELSGVKARPLGARVKAAKSEHAHEQAQQRRDSARVRRNDRRAQLTAPAPDQERLPVLHALDEVLTGIQEPEPPMRDLDGRPVEVRERQPALMHELASNGSNGAEAKDFRLPAPALPLLTVHDRFSLAHAIERYIEFVEADENGDRAVALSPTFVDHYTAFRDSALPRVTGIITAPLVTGDGAMLASDGLDRDRQLVFRIPRELRAVVPKPGDAKPSAKNAAAALDYLSNEWLCDVATNFSGKMVLVALALTIVQRVLLPERPAFFVTAGKRGGGKTTALAMIILAVTGRKPAAAAWSFSEEERRKALAAYLGEGLAAMVFDNIPLGSTISCPTIEKILTAETYSDRILGQTAITTVPAFTIMSFTGNNIAPKGDMASRSLMARLDVNRPDPENRPFQHADPIAWTIDNRGKILRALYVLLLANPQLANPQPPKTRFKRWWHLVGSAVEHAAKVLVEDQRRLPEPERYANTIDFVELFAAVEGEDEESGGLADVLDVLSNIWPDGKAFLASDVARLIEDPMEGEADAAKALKAYFEADKRSGAALSAKAAGKRLVAISGAPVPVGDYIMKLERIAREDQQAAKRATWFRVSRV